MDQAEHITEEVQPKFSTRSTARHLRRKRLNEARRAGKCPTDIGNSTNDATDREAIVKPEINETETLTKSKARRVKKKNKTQSPHSPGTSPCCYDSYVYMPIIDQSLYDCDGKKEDDTVSCSQPGQILVDPRFVTMNNCQDEQTLIDAEPSRNTVSEKIQEDNLKIEAAPDTSATNDGSSKLTSANKMSDVKMNVPEKTRKEIKAEREAKKAAKAAAKAKGKQANTDAKNVPKENRKSIDNEEQVESVAKHNIVNNKRVAQATGQLTDASNAQSICSNDVQPEAKTEEKSKAALRADRRAKQEAQRAAKQEAQRAAKQEITAESKAKVKAPPKTPVKVPSPSVDDVEKKARKTISPKGNVHEVNLFKHLYHERELALINAPAVNSDIHPAIVRLGVQYANKIIVGSNARCVALLAAVKQLIHDFERPSQADFIRGLEASLQESAAYLHHCRPLAVSMQNAIRHLKWQMTQLPAIISDKDARTKLEGAIDTYVSEQIQLAGKAISITIQTKISDGNVILTYGYSSLIHKILLDAHTAGKRFRVVVVDGRPWLEGKEQLRRLAKHGIKCSYILINALSYIMPEVSKVFLGAHAILANGAVMARVGTAQVALMARAFNVPVLVACETHKSCERVQTDSIVYNELGDADELTKNFLSDSKRSLLANWRTKKSLNLLNITYDVTPADLVTAVVTELAILPCTSVPVILRIKPSEI